MYARPHACQKRQKEETLRSAFKFKAKPRDGIAHLVKIGRCTDAPESIAKVFYELKDVLDKTAMGEFMGGEKEVNIKVGVVFLFLGYFPFLPWRVCVRPPSLNDLGRTSIQVLCMCLCLCVCVRVHVAAGHARVCGPAGLHWHVL